MKRHTDVLEHVRLSFNQAVDTATSIEALEVVRVAFLGRKGEITALLRQLSDMTLAEKQSFGPAVQELQRTAQAYYEQRRTQLESTQSITVPPLDVTAYRASRLHGGLHPYTHLIERIETLFVQLGWSIVSGPEIEDEFHNFEALNIPAHHPARDMHDTFWLTLPHRLLRTHTSSVQVRTLQRQAPPLAICAPGRTFRHEATDATHDMTFMQCEGLFIDQNISLADLIGTLTLFMEQLFAHHQVKIRVRPSYFPFVEPGLEVDISCLFCTTGCSVCKKSRWIELGGAGMVHPHLLRSCDLDPALWSGFAFGFGIERLAMLMFGINDIRLFKSGKMSVLQQFSLSLGS